MIIAENTGTSIIQIQDNALVNIIQNEAVYIQDNDITTIVHTGDLSAIIPTITLGSKQTGTDAGIFGELSIVDDYAYLCVYGGIAGVAIWKRITLFNT